MNGNGSLGQEINLIGERGFPIIEGPNHRLMEPSDLRLDDNTRLLLEQWLDIATADIEQQHDAVVLAGLRAAISIAKNLNLQSKVCLVMRDPREGDWFKVVVCEP